MKDPKNFVKIVSAAFIVLGVLNLIGELLGMASASMINDFINSDSKKLDMVADHMGFFNKWFLHHYLIHQLIHLLLSGLFLTSAIGLRYEKKWGLWLFTAVMVVKLGLSLALKLDFLIGPGLGSMFAGGFWSQYLTVKCILDIILKAAIWGLFLCILWNLHRKKIRKIFT